MNPESILKALQAGGQEGDFRSGGLLNEEQQLDFFWVLRHYSVMLAPVLSDLSSFPANSQIGRGIAAQQFASQQSSLQGGLTPLVPGGARFVPHNSGAISGTYDQAYVNEPITVGATEATQDPDQYANKPAKFGRRRFELEKIRSSWEASTEFFVRNIINGRLAAEMQSAMAPRMATDFEDLAINGDIDTVGTGKRQRLHRINDGWLKITREQSPKFSANGEFIEWHHFQQAIKSVPDHYASTSDYKWWVNPHLWYDWLEFLRNTTPDNVVAGALAGRGLAPMGFQTVIVPLLPRQQALSDSAAVVARVLGNRSGPFAFEENGDTFRLDVDGEGVVDITLPNIADLNVENRLLTAERVCDQINTQYSTGVANAAYADVCRVDQVGQLELRSVIGGGGGSVVLTALADDALPTLGLVAGTTTGAATGALFEGSSIWFSPAWNFVWHASTAEPGSSGTGMRVFTRFVQEADKMRTDAFAHLDATIEEPTATILMEDVRIARAGTQAINP